MKFHMAIAICLNLKLWINKNFVSQLQGHENWVYFYVMEAKNGHFSVFSTSWKIDWSNFFSLAHQNIFYDIWVQLTKISSKSEKILLDKILWRFRQMITHLSSIILEMCFNFAQFEKKKSFEVRRYETI